MKGMPNESLDIAIASLTDSSWRQYETAFKKWWEFCQETHINEFEPTIPQVLSFLVKEYEKGASCGSINSYRSAIALILGPEIGQDIRVKRFCKDIAKRRPPAPKYDFIWDPKIVLDFLSQWTPNESLTLEKLSMKLATPLALVTGHRIQTLTLIEVKDIEKIDDRIEIKIPARIKTSGVKRKQPILVLPTYPEDRTICAATTLE